MCTVNTMPPVASKHCVYCRRDFDTTEHPNPRKAARGLKLPRQAPRAAICSICCPTFLNLYYAKRIASPSDRKELQRDLATDEELQAFVFFSVIVCLYLRRGARWGRAGWWVPAYMCRSPAFFSSQQKNISFPKIQYFSNNGKD